MLNRKRANEMNPNRRVFLRYILFYDINIMMDYNLIEMKEMI